jgi:hypothetical protein
VNGYLGSITFLIGIIITATRLVAWEGHVSLAWQDQKETAQAAANADFRKHYSLAPGQDLKRIAPPFPDSRLVEYCRRQGVNPSLSGIPKHLVCNSARTT